MHSTVELVVGVLAIVVILLGLLTWRRRAGNSSAAKTSSFRGPTNMHYTCAGCSGQFTHTKRTVAAWEKGSRRVFCDACHKKWRNAQPPQNPSARGDAVAPSHASVGRRKPDHVPEIAYRSEAKASGGCLGVVLLMLLVPVIVLVLVVNA